MSSTDSLIKEFREMYGPFFEYREFECRCTHCADLRRQDEDSGWWFRQAEFHAFMLVLIELRTEAGFPFKVNSGYRCKDHNNAVSSTGFDGPHTVGAADISVSFERAYKLNQLASARNLGLGPNQKGDLASRFFHVDNQGPRLWNY